MDESLLSDFRVQCEWIGKLHPKDELRERFADRSFDETFEAVGRKLDPDCPNPIWLGFELLTESRFLEDKHYWFYGE